ncbi:hypothetical protein NDS46_25480 [Paenibacillus thiaminolyticus]|nr:hypothetical protein [Paenibacillus thiaminolyticus]WCF07620.1 hypothetical protein NDS46_25480 [Paenibacillus thiaminolyticus]
MTSVFSQTRLSGGQAMDLLPVKPIRSVPALMADWHFFHFIA